jgi:hypothetical protein
LKSKRSGKDLVTMARWQALVRSRYGVLLLAAMLLCVCVGVLALLPCLRAAEARVAAAMLTFVMFPDAQVPPSGATVFFRVTDGQQMGIEIAPESCAALLSLPLLLATVALAWLRPADVRRALLSLAAAVGALVAQNQLRVLLAACLADGVRPADRGSVGSAVFGSMSTVVCLALAVGLFVFVFTGAGRRGAAVSAGAAE